MANGRFQLAAVIVGLLAFLANLPASSPASTMDLAKELYVQGKADEGRRMILSGWAHAPRGLAEIAQGKTYSIMLAAELHSQTKTEILNALSWEKEFAHAKDGSAELLAILQAGRTALADLQKVMREKRSSDDDSYFFDFAAFELGTIVRAELAQLEAAHRETEAQKLRGDLAPVLAQKEPKLNPDSSAILLISHARPGPLQRVHACYTMHMPDEARARFLKVLETMRDQVRQSVTNRSNVAGVMHLPQTMAEYSLDMVSWEAAQTSETTRQQFFPATARPTLEKALGLIQESYDPLAEVNPDAAALRKCAQFVQRLRAIAKEKPPASPGK